MRGFTKSEASVTNRRSGNQDERGLHKPYKYSGGNGERDPPVPIPNTEVKPFSADGTWLETARESRSLPDSIRKRLSLRWVFFLFNRNVNILPERLSQVQHRTWLGEPWAASSGRREAHGERPGALIV